MSPKPVLPGHMSERRGGGDDDETPRGSKASKANGPGPPTHTFTGVESYEVSLESQTATVVAGAGLPYEKVLKTISKTGKKVNSGEADGEARGVEVPADA